jgi:electron transfer flavoprotein beta subunit
VELIVLVKQVPEPDTMPDKGGMMNPYDELALEEALQIREEHGGTVTAISLGAAHCKKVVRTALAMGADKGVFIIDEIDETDEHLEGLELAHCFAHLIKSMPFDLILAGYQTLDIGNSIVGPALAELLNIPNISMVIKQEIKNNKIRCRQQLEKGYQDVEAPLPALITTENGLNTPRYVSLPGIRRAKNKPLEVHRLEDIKPYLTCPDKSSLQRIGFARMEQDRAQKIITEGEAWEKAQTLSNSLWNTEKMKQKPAIS